MKIIFVLDDNSAVVTSPEELQLRQIQPDLAALVIPAGQNEDKEDLFRPLITYPVVLSAVPPKAEPVAAAPVAPQTTAPTDISTKKKTKKKA